MKKYRKIQKVLLVVFPALLLMLFATLLLKYSYTKQLKQQAAQEFTNLLEEEQQKIQDDWNENVEMDDDDWLLYYADMISGAEPKVIDDFKYFPDCGEEKEVVYDVTGLSTFISEDPIGKWASMELIYFDTFDSMMSGNAKADLCLVCADREDGTYVYIKPADDDIFDQIKYKDKIIITQALYQGTINDESKYLQKEYGMESAPYFDHAVIKIIH